MALKIRKHELSVIIATCRPKWLVNCLHQLENQKETPDHEVLIVAEGEGFRAVERKYPQYRYFFKSVEGKAGAFAKDYGIMQAVGNYVCFWDDDNLYEADAMKTLYEAAYGVDIGIARARIMGLDWKTIPDDQEIRFANLDTMCLCVKRSLAIKERWSDHEGKGTDYFWVKKLLGHNPEIRFVETVVGDHLD